MVQFNLEDYETVDERLRRFWADENHADARIVTHNITDDASRAAGIWVVRTEIFLSAGDQSLSLPKATGLAFEVDGGPGANRTSALENAETSSIGRALANMNFSGNKRPSREEMAKASGKPVSRKAFDVQEELKNVKSKAEARALWVKASKAGVGSAVLDSIVSFGEGFES